eukprot:scaffold890_cov269-Pinguiococcus_pyrenoidosus.AAC.7
MDPGSIRIKFGASPAYLLLRRAQIESFFLGVVLEDVHVLEKLKTELSEHVVATEVVGVPDLQVSALYPEQNGGHSAKDTS